MRRHLTHAVKVTVAYALYYTGAFRLWQLVAMRNRAVVLMYHRVLSEDEQRRTGSHPGIVVTRDTFARHMALVKERFLVLTAEQLGDHLAERRPLPPAACVITFDDGWRDNLTGAVPVLRRLNLPAVIFLPVNFIGERRLFWRESLTHLLVDAVRTVRTNTSCRAQLARALESSGLDHLLGVTDGDPRSAVIDAIARSPRLTEASAHCLMQSIESILKRPLDLTSTPDSFVTWDEVRDMAAAGITFGGHGVDHRRLGELPSNEADQEIRGSMRVVSTHLAAPVLSFSYPHGSFTSEVREMVKASGYQFAFTTQAGFVSANDDPYTIKRVNIHEDMTDSAPMFMARVLGLF